MRNWTQESRAKIAESNRRRGCSQETREKLSIASSGKNNPRWGKKASPETRAKIAEKTRQRIVGDGNPRWAGGRYKNYAGYIYVVAPGHPHCDVRGYVAEHRLIVEAGIGRILAPHEVVHHINGDVTDNRIENLMLFDSLSSHAKWHISCRRTDQAKGPK